MRDWIAVIITVLGVLLVLAGATLILLRALPVRPPASADAAGGSSAAGGPSTAGGSSAAVGSSASVGSFADSDAVTVPVADHVSAPVPVTARIAGAWKVPSPADRLIFWGIVLLVLAAIAAGAITFNLGAAGGATPATR